MVGGETKMKTNAVEGPNILKVEHTNSKGKRVIQIFWVPNGTIDERCELHITLNSRSKKMEAVCVNGIGITR